MTRLGLRSLAVALVMLLAGAVPSLGDAREIYGQALEAYEAGNHAEAARLFTRAVAEDPEAKGLLGGAFLKRYTPHFYLGLSLAELGRCREAARALDESERQGKIKDRDLQLLQEARRECRRQIGIAAQAADDARRVADDAAAIAFEVAQIADSPVLEPVWEDGSPSLARRQEEATGLLAEARDSIQKGEQSLDPELVARGERLADRAREQLRSLLRDARERRDELLPRVRARLAELEELADRTEREARFVRSRFAPLPKALAEILEVTEASIAVARDADEGTSLDLIDQVERELRNSLQRLRDAVQAPPELLVQAAESLLGGDYRRTLELLEELEAEDSRVADQACLLGAGARFGLSRIQEEPEADPERVVDRALATCPRAPEIEPPERYFSPEFRADWDRALEKAEAEVDETGEDEPEEEGSGEEDRDAAPPDEEPRPG